MRLDINPLNISETEFEKYSLRETSRGVICDAENNIALIHISKEGKYKLPGGGIEEGETSEEALIRECSEEAGVVIESLKEIGTIREIHSENTKIQISHCYIARVYGTKSIPQFSKEELDRGFVVEWMSLEEAIARITREGYGNELGKYVFERDLAILTAAKKVHYE